MLCFVAAVRSLHVEELAEVLAFDLNAEGTPQPDGGWRWENQEEAMVSACSNLVTVVKIGHSRVVRFSHYSVEEFLIPDCLAGQAEMSRRRYHLLLPQPAHTTLAQACFLAFS